MKNGKIRVAAFLVSTIIILTATGCALLPASIAGGPAGETGAVAATAPPQADEGLKQEELKGIRNAIRDYFVKLYAQDVGSYEKNNATGAIPENIKSFIAGRTLNEGDMNPEVGIHFPRYVSINGLTAISYSIISKKGAEGTEIPQIEASYLGKKGDSLMFFAKVDLKAGCVPDGVFNTNFRQNGASGAYEKIPNAAVGEGQIESIKLQVCYNIEVLSQDDGYKILSARESSLVPGARNRLSAMNNDFVTRLPYLDITKGQDGKTYNNTEDGAIYEKEAAMISSFFENLKNLDGERMSLLRQRWATGQKEFTDFLAKTGVTKDGDSKELMNIGSDYRTRFDIDSFPLQPNMEKITDLEGFSVAPYISYSSRQKVYTVKFVGAVKMINGLIDSANDYKYNFKVYLSGTGDTLRLSAIKLDEYYGVNNQ